MSTLVPGMIQQPSDFTVALALYDPIVGFDAQDKPAPTGLASKWTSSPDLKTWTFTLRPGVTFTDGTPVNAQAVVTQVNAQKALPDCGCQADMAHITNVEAVDEHTVRFTLDQSNVSFPGLLAGNAGYLAAPAAWAAGAATMTSKPLGSGPFKVLTPGSLTLVRNPSYWRKSATGHTLPYLDKITFDPLADSTARIPSLRDGKVDILQTADTLNLVQAKKDPTLVVQPVTGSSSTIIVLNSHKAPFNDIRLRQAFNYALDREALNKGYYSDSRLAAYGPLEPSNPYYDAKGQLPHYDLAKAKALVGQLKAEQKPTTFTSTCINTTEATSLEAIIKRLDAAAGMNLNIETIDQGTLVNRLIAAQRRLPGLLLPQLAGGRPRRPLHHLLPDGWAERVDDDGPDHRPGPPSGPQVDRLRHPQGGVRHRAGAARQGRDGRAVAVRPLRQRAHQERERPQPAGAELARPHQPRRPLPRQELTRGRPRGRARARMAG